MSDTFWASVTATFALSAISFYGVAVAMRESKKTSDVINLGIAGLALVLAGALLPSQIGEELVATPDSHSRLCGLILTAGSALFIVSYLAFLAYYIPHSDEIAAGSQYRKTWLEAICYWISYLFFFAGFLWCIGFAWIVGMVALEISFLI